ncbi:MAG: class I SAM-dependent methyltransferase family protein [Candidatus Woesearchaeota archaeon]
MLALKVSLKNAQKWKKYLLETDILDKEYRIKKDITYIYFPLKKKLEIIRGDAEIVDMQFSKAQVSGKLKENLAEKLSEEELKFVKTAHDIVGDIAILEIPKDLTEKEKIIAETLLSINKNIKTVLKKADVHEGIFRTQKMIFLAGEDKRETFYKENNCIFKVDVEKVYFSVRLSNERKRIFALVKPMEEILVMFSGAAPYPVVISKNTKAKHIVGIEINPEGHKYGVENIRLNKCKNIELICGDVHNVIPILKDQGIRFDRIIMPLPKTADEFLDDAFSVSKNNTILHFYDFLDEKNFDEAIKKIDFSCKKNNLNYKILNIIKCGQHAPHIFRVCVDFEVFN